MPLKSFLETDMSTFINIDEFGETHTINGKTFSIVKDDDRLEERSKKEYDGISVGSILYFVKKSDFGKRPEQGASQIFDNKPMYVFDSREDSGMYEIILQQNRGG